MMCTAVMVISLDIFTTLLGHASEVAPDSTVFNPTSDAEELFNDTQHDALQGLVLLQTEMEISDSMALNKSTSNFAAVGAAVGAAGASNAQTSVMRRVWAFLGYSDSPTAAATAAAENAKRFHRDFIAAALLMCCVLPWARRQEGQVNDGSEHDSGDVADEFERSSLSIMSNLCFELPQGLLGVLPAFHGLRYISVILLFLQHYWFQGSFIASQPLLLLAGFILDFVETRRHSEDSIWTKYAGAIPDRFTRLYPLYALHVILCYLSFPLPGLPDGEGSFIQRTFSGTAWAVSVVFGSYILLPVLTDQPQDIPDNVVAMLSAACVALVVLPRTLAFPAMPSTSDKELDLNSSQDTASAEMIFVHQNLLLGLAYFFTGIVVGRFCLSLRLDRYIPQLAWLLRSGKEIKAESNSEEVAKHRVRQQESDLSEENLSHHTELLGSQDLLSVASFADCLDN